MLLFFVSLIICIIAHELGHLIVAKMCKCGVEVFSLGFGKPILFSKKIGKTLYQVTPWIFGGYCKLQDETKSSKKKNSFTNLPYRKKAAITLAGVTVNIVLGVISILIATSLVRASFIDIRYILLCFGMLNITLGISNLLPIPALDGSYLILVWLEKIYGKKVGYAKMDKICHWGFIILMALNIACLPYLYYLIKSGGIR